MDSTVGFSGTKLSRNKLVLENTCVKLRKFKKSGLRNSFELSAELKYENEKTTNFALLNFVTKRKSCKNVPKCCEEMPYISNEHVPGFRLSNTAQEWEATHFFCNILGIFF